MCYGSGESHHMGTPQVLDEADRLLDMDFGPKLDQILKLIPKERTTYLFSATMTTKVAKLQRASLSNPVRVEVNSKYVRRSTVMPDLTTCEDIRLYQPCYNTISSCRCLRRTCT